MTRKLQTKIQKRGFSKTRRRSGGVSLESETLIRSGYLSDEHTYPIVLEPNLKDVDPVDWAAENREYIERNLSQHGAILFRGFELPSVPEFERFSQAICPHLFGEYGDLPREEEGKKIYQSTPYPKDKMILFHNESSHMNCWPMRQFFFCIQPALVGGETPLIDCRETYRRLEPEIRDRFERKGLMYVRNFTEQLDVSWQKFFGTDDKKVVEDQCQEASMTFEWNGDQLRTQQLCPAVAKHPKTGEMVFFNQIQLHHSSSFESEERESMFQLFTEQTLPRNVCYGDGSPIEDSVMESVGDLYNEIAVSFPWQAGDVVMLDNMLVAHARNPFSGPRKIAVAMGEMFHQKDLAA